MSRMRFITPPHHSTWRVLSGRTPWGAPYALAIELGTVRRAFWGITRGHAIRRACSHIRKADR